MKKVVESKKAPTAIGPYSQAVVFEKLVFTSGQIPIDPETGEMLAADIKKQTIQVMNNLKEVLKETGSDFDKVLKSTIYVKDLKFFSEVNEIYKSYFKNAPPARSTVEVSKLPKDSLVEIDMVAFLD